jgi:ribonuclease PH
MQVMEEDGAVLACAVNAACVALVNAGVPLRSTFGEDAFLFTSALMLASN